MRKITSLFEFFSNTALQLTLGAIFKEHNFKPNIGLEIGLVEIEMFKHAESYSATITLYINNQKVKLEHSEEGSILAPIFKEYEKYKAEDGDYNKKLLKNYIEAALKDLGQEIIDYC